MPYKDPKNPKNIEYKKKYYQANKDTIWSYAQRKGSSDKWRRKNKVKVSEYSRKRRKNNRNDLIEKSRRYWNESKETLNKKDRLRTELLTDGYMKKHLRKHGYSPQEIKQHPELTESYRLIIKMKRLCKTSKN